jgi:hypothetical protein
MKDNLRRKSRRNKEKAYLGRISYFFREKESFSAIK